MLLALIFLVAMQHPRSAPDLAHAVSHACAPGGCDYLIVENGEVIDFAPQVDRTLDRQVVLGNYIASAQALVPKAEPPIREIRTKSGWTVVVTGAIEPAALTSVRIRLIAPTGKIAATASGDELLTLAKAGELFGGKDEFAAVCQSAVHPGTDHCRIWWLRRDDTAVKIFDFPGKILGFVNVGTSPGVWTEQTTPINDDPNRTLTSRDFWRWSPSTGLSKQPHS